MPDFVPRGSTLCGCGWTPALIWLDVAGQAVTALAYFAVPFLMVWARRRFPEPFPYKRQWNGFALFIILCGLGHAVGAATFFTGRLYWVEAWLGAARAAVSVLVGVDFLMERRLIVSSMLAAAEAFRANRAVVAAAKKTAEDAAGGAP